MQIIQHLESTYIVALFRGKGKRETSMLNRIIIMGRFVRSQGGEAATDYGEPPPESGGFHEIDDEDGTLPF